MSLREVQEGQAQSLASKKQGVQTGTDIGEDEHGTPQYGPDTKATPRGFSFLTPQPKEKPQPQTRGKQSDVPVFKPGVFITGSGEDTTTRVTLRPGQSSDLRWKKGKETTTGTEYTFEGIIINPPKTTGIKTAERMTTGQIISGGLRESALHSPLNIFYSGQQGPEQLAMAPDVITSRGPSTRSIMASGLVNVGAGAAFTGVLGNVIPAASGIMKVGTVMGSQRLARIGQIAYKGSRVGLIGTTIVGTGAMTYDIGTKYSKGELTSRDVAVEVFTTGAFFVGAGGGALSGRNIFGSYRGKQTTDLLKQASDINIHTGTPGSVRVGMSGELYGRDILNTRVDVIRNNMKVAETFQHTEDLIYKPSGKPELFLEDVFNQKGGKIISLGSAEVQNRIIPGVEKPTRIDLLTGIEYRTGEQNGLIRSTKSFLYTKYEPEFKPYSDFERTPLKIQKSLSDVLGTETKLNLKSNEPVTGVTSGSTRMVLDTNKALSLDEIGNVPVFNMYPPGSRMITPFVILPVTRSNKNIQESSGVSGLLGMSLVLGFKSELSQRRASWSTSDVIQGLMPNQKVFRFTSNIPVMDITSSQDVISRQNVATRSITDVSQILDQTQSQISLTTDMTRIPMIPVLPSFGGLDGLFGGGGEEPHRRRKGARTRMHPVQLYDLRVTVAI